MLTAWIDSEVSALVVLRPLAIAVATSLILTVVAAKLLADPHRGALAVMALLVLLSGASTVHLFAALFAIAVLIGVFRRVASARA